MGKHKQDYGKTRLGMFISKASESLPELVGTGFKLATGNFSGALEDVSGILTANKNRNEANRLLFQEFEIKKIDFAKECFSLEVEDRKDARGLYKVDNIIQKIFSIIFLLGYGLLSWYLLQVLMQTTEMNKLAETMITMIWTGTSTKLGTIIDFLFGGSVK
tara:strand:+ start:604 stop:1086 length:483 start_codon:yes stop_codon:yes gene_type:complete